MMKTKIVNYIWDFDGMLFDTYPHTTAALCETLRRRGVPFDPDEVYEKLKITVWDALRFYGADDAFVRAFYELENTLTFEPVGRPYDGIPALLREISARGGRNFLYSHRDRVACAYLDLYGLTPLFSGFVTAENGFPHKPAPDAIRWLTAEYGLDPTESMMLGDRLIDVGAGKNAGIRTCLFDEDGRFSRDDADFYCRDIPGLTAIAESLLP